MPKSKPPLRPDNSSIAAIDKRIDAAMRHLDDATALMVDQVYRPYCKLLVMYRREGVDAHVVYNSVATLVANVVHEVCRTFPTLGSTPELEETIMEVAQHMLDVRNETDNNKERFH